MWQRSVLSLLAVVAFISPVLSRITHADIRSDYRSSITLSRPFGFTSAGEPYLGITLTNPSVYWRKHDDTDLSCFSFYIANSDFETLDPEAPDGTCTPEDANTGSSLTKLVDFSEPTIAEIINSEEDTSSDPVLVYESIDKRELTGGLHTLYFVNCCTDRAVVTFQIRTEMYNKINGSKSYLSVGELELPSTYLVFFLLFSVGLGIWSYTVYVHKSSAHRIHYIMIALGAFKVLTLLAQLGMYHYLRVTGKPDGWNVAYYIFTFFRSIFLFTVIILIGTGWSYMTPFLGKNEKTVLMIVLPFQVLIDISVVVIDEYTPAYGMWFTWRDLMHFMDIICCCAILFPIAWRIRHLREASATDGKAERSMQQLIMFRHFYIMVVVYVYFTRIVVYLLQSTLPGPYVWIADGAEELGTLIFYALTAAQFRPHPTNEYTKLVSESETLVSSQEIEMGEW